MLHPQPNILVVAGNGECACLLKNLEGLGSVETTQTIAETLRQLKSQDFDILFCAWDIEEGTWTDLMSQMKQHGIELPTVVYYHCGGEQEWLRALDGGAFDLLVPPFDRYKLTVLLEHALASASWQKQVA